MRLDEMLENVGLSFIGRNHSGIDDTKNIVRILIQIKTDGATPMLNEQFDCVAQQFYSAMMVPKKVRGNYNNNNNNNKKVVPKEENNKKVVNKEEQDKPTYKPRADAKVIKDKQNKNKLKIKTPKGFIRNKGRLYSAKSAQGKKLANRLKAKNRAKEMAKKRLGK